MANLRPRGIIRLGYVHIEVDATDLPDLRHFYCDTVGLVEQEVESEVRCADPQRLFFRCWHEAHPCSFVIEAGRARRLVEIGFEVAEAEDLHVLARRIESSGSRVSCTTDTALPGVGESIGFEAPGGLAIRLYAPNAAKVAYLVGHVSPDWVTPRALRATTAPLYLNHVGVTVPDPQATVDFLTRVLDFRISERIESDDAQSLRSALLFRMSKDVGGQELAVFRGARIGLHHIAFTKEDPNDILIDGQYLAAARVHIDPMGPTRQPYGKTFSLHFYDPRGLRLELCSGGRVTEAHPEFEPVVWTESHLSKALSSHDESVSADFLNACM